MARTNFEQLLEAGSHFGHLKRKWNPHMAPYIFTEKKGIHIIDLHKSIVKIDEAAAAMKQIAKKRKENPLCFYKEARSGYCFCSCKGNRHALHH